MKHTILFLILFFNFSLCQEKNHNNIEIEYLEPINNFNVKINWTIYESIEDINTLIGPAIFEVKRLSDNKNFTLNNDNFSIKDSIYCPKIYDDYKKRKLPNILQLDYEKKNTNFFFQDLNFDNELEFVVIETVYESGELKNYYIIYEFGYDKFEAIDYFPTEALEWSGEIDYVKKEVIARDYLNCCDYIADYYKFDINNPEKFVLYKTEEHKVDATTENEEITIKEKGKKDVIIFKKKE